MLDQQQHETETQIKIKLKAFFLGLTNKPVIFNSLRLTRFLGIIGVSWTCLSPSEAIKVISHTKKIDEAEIVININVKNGHPQVQGNCRQGVITPYNASKPSQADMTVCINGVTGGGRGDFYTIDVLGFVGSNWADPVVTCTSLSYNGQPINIPIQHGPHEGQNQAANRGHLAAALSDNWTITLQADGKCSLSGS